MNEASSVVPWLTQTNPRWRRPPSLILEKKSITPDWIKISAPNFMGRCTEDTQRWPRDQKLKPEVNSRDVIKWRSEAYVCRSQWLSQIFKPNLAQNTNTTLLTCRNGQIHTNWKSQMAAAAILNFGKMSITLDWIKISCIKWYGNMHHGDAEMTTWPKVETEVNSRDVIKWRSEACASISVTITDIWTKFGTPITLA